MEDIIIQAHAPGLGDNLLYATLPQLYTSRGHRVFVSTLPAPGHKEAFRNDEIRQIVWECNPYVKGFVEKEPNAGNVFVDLKYIKLAKQIGPIPAIERLHSFDPSGSHSPVVFYQPQMLDEWKDTTVIDPSSISQPISKDTFTDYAGWASRWHDLGPKFCVVKSRFHGQNGSDTLDYLRQYTVKDIFEYADILFSAKACLMNESGNQALSAALRDTGTFACFTQMAYNDRIFVFPNVHHYITGRMTPDFHHYPLETFNA